MHEAAITVERTGGSAVVHLHGDLVVASAREIYQTLRAVARGREVEHVVLDFGDVGRIDSSGIAIVSVVGKELERQGKQLELTALRAAHRAAFELVPKSTDQPPAERAPGALERIGDRVYGTRGNVGSLLGLMADVARQSLAVMTGKRRLPAASVISQISRMGVDALFIVGLLSLLIGMTTAFQAVTQLQRIGAGVFVADMVGVSMVRELAPLMTAVILTGRTGAAIAAELGTMKVRSEVDALAAMGVNPVRFLVVPRMIAITLVVPALTLIAMFVGMLGGMIVAGIELEMPAVAFWSRMIARVDLGDYVHGIGKSFVFAWIIGLAGCHLGIHGGRDASSVGSATTRTVVASIFFIIVVDAVFATVSTMTRYP